jgi:hypothetical protein
MQSSNSAADSVESARKDIPPPTLEEVKLACAKWEFIHRERARLEKAVKRRLQSEARAEAYAALQGYIEGRWNLNRHATIFLDETEVKNVTNEGRAA